MLSLMIFFIETLGSINFKSYRNQQIRLWETLTNTQFISNKYATGPSINITIKNYFLDAERYTDIYWD